MTAALYQVDSFTDQPFAGNPAGVCILAAPQTETWMQALAREMNLSETAFLLPEGAGYRLRWFTPKIEVSLCGHATLASAHILWQQGLIPTVKMAIFETLSGRLTAALEADNWIALDFPVREIVPAEPPTGLLEALGAKNIRFIGRYKNSFLVELADEADVRAVSPDFDALLEVDTRSLVVTAQAADPAFDFVSRYFAPAVGVNEDPVTGSVHCALAPYWGLKLGKAEMRAFQASARGGILRVRPQGDRVIILGQAVTIFEGRLEI